MTAPFRLEPLHGQHDRSTFASGEEALDRYFRTQVTQDLRCRIANCFVAVDVATGQVVAYYTIASASIPNHGFRQLASPPGTLFLPLATAAKILLDPSEL